MQLTKNFKLEEFNCKDGTAVPDKYIPNVLRVARNLQVLRDQLAEPIHINSAYRTRSYNKSVGGASASQHLTANAADIRVKNKTPKQLSAIVESLITAGKLEFKGLGIYPTFIHVDCRQKKARW